MADPVREQLAALPRSPGVYLFRDESDDVLYVGQGEVAAGARAELLQPRRRPPWASTAWWRGSARIEVIVTSSEAEALHLEQNLVKRHRPPFNVRLRDDKSFPYIAVTVADEYPRVMFTRERHRRGTVYFGPYANAKKVRETLDVLNRVFQFRPCEGPKPGRHSGIPCLDFHIERCTAPCIGAISKEAYREQIDGVIDFLSGDTRTIVRSLEARMREASAEERFEDATRYRNRLLAIESLAERQGADRRAVGTIDVIGLAVDGDRAAVQLFPLRDGRLIDRYAFHLENVEGQDRATILEGFCLEYYTAAPSVPPQLIVPSDLTDTEALAGFLSELRGAAVEVRAPVRGEKKRLAELAAENAELALTHETTAAEQKRLRRIEALESLREVAQPREPAGPDRVLRHLEPPGSRHRRLDVGVRRCTAEEGALPLVHGPRARRPGRLRVDGAGDRPSVRASPGCRGRGPLRRELRDRARTSSSSTAARGSWLRRSRRSRRRQSCRGSP